MNQNPWNLENNESNANSIFYASKTIKIEAWILLELSSLKDRLLIRRKNTDDLLILKYLRKTSLFTKIGCQNELIVLTLSLLSLILIKSIKSKTVLYKNY